MANTDNPDDTSAENPQTSPLKKALQVSYDLIRRNSKLFSRPLIRNHKNHKKP